MRRCVLFGFALSLLCSAASFAAAQDSLLPIPKLPGIPRIEEPIEPLLANESLVEVKVSPNTGVPRLAGPEEPKLLPVIDLALQSSDYIDARYLANSQHPDDIGIWERTRNGYSDQLRRLKEDYKTFYLGPNLLYVGIAVAVAAPIANTRADHAIRNWYQNQAGQGRSAGADNTADVFKQFGEYKYAIPLYFLMSFSEHVCPDMPMMSPISDFGNRSLRALAVGAPAVGILQIGLGSGRPFTEDSNWSPLRHSNGVSGHAFVGAVPFLTAASMTESRALQALLIAGSLAPAWSRIHTDDHYFSQVLLGWSIAYLSVQTVNQTESRFHIVPIEIPNGMGMGVVMQY